MGCVLDYGMAVVSIPKEVLMSTKLEQLAEAGQAVWLDYIQRSLITSGELEALIDEGLRGITSNPSIFQQAIAGSLDYDEELEDLVRESKTADEIYEALVLKDIALAADLLRPVYDRTQGLDGYVSLEVNPRLAQDTEGTVAEARRFVSLLQRPNILIKVPATPAGVPAIRTLIGEGISINVTLIFSVAHYEGIADAYISGLEDRASARRDLHSVSSVASLFISRVDSMVDPVLEERGARDLFGKIALANTKVVYARFGEIFHGERWQRLAALGARVQRPLWASTSAKNPSYPDTLYVDSLIGPDTVNTLPPQTLAAVRDHTRVAQTLELGLGESRAQLARFAELGFDLDQFTEKLQEEGVDKFIQSFDSLMQTITDRRATLLTQ